MSQKGKLEIKDMKNVTVISFLDVAILDETSIKELGDEMEEVVKSKEEINLVVNFTNVDYLSSAVLGRLVKVFKMVRKQKGKMKLCGIKSSILQVFKITRLDKMFEILPDEDKAIKSFKKPFKLWG